jgi:uncharacterized tellurite resistance protein B-like protein
MLLLGFLQEPEWDRARRGRRGPARGGAAELVHHRNGNPGRSQSAEAASPGLARRNPPGTGSKTMKAYAKNSPEAISRILAMMMITDAKLDDREIEIMDQLRILDIIGISRSGFSQVVQDYCSGLLGGGTRDGKIRLLDKDRVNEIVDLVDDPKKRVDTCGMILNIANADGKIHDTELAVFGYILERWGMTLESLEHDLTSAAGKA